MSFSGHVSSAWVGSGFLKQFPAARFLSRGNATFAYLLLKGSNNRWLRSRDSSPGSDIEDEG